MYCLSGGRSNFPRRDKNLERRPADLLAVRVAPIAVLTRGESASGTIGEALHPVSAAAGPADLSLTGNEEAALTHDRPHRKILIDQKILGRVTFPSEGRIIPP